MTLGLLILVKGSILRLVGLAVRDTWFTLAEGGHEGCGREYGAVDLFVESKSILWSGSVHRALRTQTASRRIARSQRLYRSSYTAMPTGCSITRENQEATLYL